jgi:hypothetical protein
MKCELTINDLLTIRIAPKEKALYGNHKISLNLNELQPFLGIFSQKLLFSV